MAHTSKSKPTLRIHRQLTPTLEVNPFDTSATDDDPLAIYWEIPDAAWQEFQIERTLQEAESWDRK